MEPLAADAADASRRPLCGQPNDCQHCTPVAYHGPCWCAKVEIPGELIEQVEPDLRNKACVCQACVTNFHRVRETSRPPPKILPGDFYFDGGIMVFNAVYHLRRGYYCGHGCRHCPYQVIIK